MKRADIQKSSGYVYLFGGKKETRNRAKEGFCFKNFRYDIAKNEWSQVASNDRCIYSFNLINFARKFILVVMSEEQDHDQDGEHPFLIYNYKTDQWLKVYSENDDRFTKGV